MSRELPPRISLGTTPTPLEPVTRLTSAWGGPQIWVKRDDLTGFGLSGTKVRKLEFHLAAARNAGADTVITCGAMQSNHARTTVLAAARIGLRAVLFLRTSPDEPDALAGNYLLDRIAAAHINPITPTEWLDRDQIMERERVRQATAGHPSWVIPEGASDALGMWGSVLAMREVADQISVIDGRPPVMWHAASSGGTSAGIGWAVDRLGLDLPVVACSIGDTRDDLASKVSGIWHDAAHEMAATAPTPDIEYLDSHIGGGYGVVDDAALAVQAEATSLTGLVFDPTYTGKALVGLKREIEAGRYGPDDNVVFWHTGGGFAVFSHDFSRIAAVERQDARGV